MNKAILYIHGKGGSASESGIFAKSCQGFDVLGVDYDDGDLPCVVKSKIIAAYDSARENYDVIYVLANSIGAYFAMLSLGECEIEKALFISPVVDLQALILGMMKYEGISEEDLRTQGKIGMFSWEYLSFVRENPVKWNTFTAVLYAEGDELISRHSIDNFIATHNAILTVMSGGEHWFHTEEQLAFLNNWLSNSLPKADCNSI